MAKEKDGKKWTTKTLLGIDFEIFYYLTPAGVVIDEIKQGGANIMALAMSATIAGQTLEDYFTQEIEHETKDR